MNNVIAITAFQDNYIWMLTSEKAPDKNSEQSVIIIDPGDARPVLEYLHSHHLIPAAIFITHQCYDHVGGIKAILDQYTQYTIPVYGPATEIVPCMTHPVKQGDIITINPTGPNNEECHFQVLDVPGHTAGHVAYFQQGAPGRLFCGDTLFAAGCGRLHTGLYSEMFHSLQKIAALPDDTLIYCAHEYTLANLKFACQLEPDNSDLQTRMAKTTQMRKLGQITIPSQLSEEKKTNPFLRCNTPAVTAAAKRYAEVAGLPQPSDATSVFRTVRDWKDRF